jgi:hypothetical protein
MEISNLIMSLMKLKAGGVTFCNPHGQNTVSRIMDGFVDDTTIWSNAFLASLKSD